MEPQNYQDAINDPIYGKEWELAIKEELMKNGACEPVELPPCKNLVTGNMGILSCVRNQLL